MASNSNKKSKKSFLIILFLVGFGVVVGLFISLGIAQGVKETGDAKFCVKCHTMQPMADAYHASTHGGSNKAGVRAECNDCHLPHNNVANYLYQKAMIGFHDIKVQTFGDLKSIDWEEKRKHARDYVFDSGCLSCHENLKDATMGTPKGYLAHRQYFLKFVDKKCVDCHKNVGHYNLGGYIKKAKKLQKEQ